MLKILLINFTYLKGGTVSKSRLLKIKLRQTPKKFDTLIVKNLVEKTPHDVVIL